MEDDVYVYLTDLPDGINEMVAPCRDGYTVYIDKRLDFEHRRRAYRHALRHIERNDFAKTDADRVEAEAHDGGIL